MAKCILHFDQIEIISKKSDAAHSDNDWLIVHWFVGTDLKESHTIPLKNTSGSTILESGQTLQPLSLEVACVDADLVTAVFQIVNLGSTDIAAQVQAIGKIAQKGADTFAEVYLTIAAKVLPLTPTPAGEIIGQAIELLKPLLVDGVGAAFE